MSPDSKYIKSVSCVEGGLTAEYGSGKITFKGGELAVGAEVTVKLSYVEAAPGEFASTIATTALKINIPYGGISYVGEGFNGRILKNSARWLQK